MNIGIVNYQAGNLGSLSTALTELDVKFFVSDKASELSNSSLILIPGVGSMSSGMQNIRHSNLDEVIVNHAIAGKPVLGICLGMHLLATSGEEGGNTLGLNLIEGEVKRLQPLPTYRVPHMGWDLVDQQEVKSFGYFAHSYFFRMSELENQEVISTFQWGAEVYPAEIRSKNIAGIQYHPEKSGKDGLNALSKVIRNLNEVCQ
jgi:glutamine amidotransferase